MAYVISHLGSERERVLCAETPRERLCTHHCVYERADERERPLVSIVASWERDQRERASFHFVRVFDEMRELSIRVDSLDR